MSAVGFGVSRVFPDGRRTGHRRRARRRRRAHGRDRDGARRVRVFHSRVRPPRAVSRRRRPIDAVPAARRVEPRRRHRRRDGARPPADAGAVRRLGRVFRRSCCSGSAAAGNPHANPDGARGRYALATEIGVVIAEAVLLVVFALPLWFDRTSAQPSADGAVVVRVVAEQFAWNVHYPGADGRFGETKLCADLADQSARARSTVAVRQGRHRPAQPDAPADQPAGRSSSSRARTSFTASACRRCA